MAETKTLNLRVDADLKHQAERIFSDLGIPTSTAINMFLRTVVILFLIVTLTRTGSHSDLF